MSSHSRRPRPAARVGAAMVVLVLGLAVHAQTTPVAREETAPETVALPPIKGDSKDLPINFLPAPPSLPTVPPSATTPPAGATPAKEDTAKKTDALSLVKGDGSHWPFNSPPGPLPPLSPVPGYPPHFDMGGFPPPPTKKDSLESLQEFIRENLSVKLRGAGTLRFYGLFRGDFDFATARFATDTENPFFVLPNDTRFRIGANFVPIKPNDKNYALYPRLTRFGAEYYGDPIDCLGGAVSSGRIEFDFLTNELITDPLVAALNPESRPLLRLRLAYATLTSDEFTFLIGQDWDIIAPLNPTINDNTLQWNAGNMGDRRPQAKFLWNHHLDKDVILQVQNGLALAAAIGNPDVELNGLRDNESSGLPGYEGRLGLIAPSHVENEKFMAGVWGLLAISRVNGTIPPPPIPVPGQIDPPPTLSKLENFRFLSNGIGIDLRLPIVEDLTFQCEWWYGQNLADFRGGIGQGINLPRKIPVHSKGGWAEFIYRVCPWYQVAVGFSIDDPRDSDLIGINQPLFAGFEEGLNKGFAPKLNHAYYLSNRFLVGNGLTFGADYTNWNTEYVSFRAGHASLFKFFMQQAF